MIDFYMNRIVKKFTKKIIQKVANCDLNKVHHSLIFRQKFSLNDFFKESLNYYCKK